MLGVADRALAQRRLAQLLRGSGVVRGTLVGPRAPLASSVRYDRKARSEGHGERMRVKVWYDGIRTANTVEPLVIESAGQRCEIAGTRIFWGAPLTYERLTSVERTGHTVVAKTLEPGASVLVRGKTVVVDGVPTFQATGAESDPHPPPATVMSVSLRLRSTRAIDSTSDAWLWKVVGMNRAVVLALALMFSGAGCTNPRDRYDDFGDRVVDASTAPEVDGAVVSELPALEGEWLVRARPDLIEDRFFNFRGTIVFTPLTANTGTLELTLQPLDYETLEPVGAPIDGDPVDVNSDGSFDWPMVGVIPARCNSITGSNANIDAVVHGTATTDDLHCGGLTGTAGALDLIGMTYAAVRIVGPDLPTPAHACP